jgi:hypothetical protein
MENVAISFLDKVLTPKMIEELQGSGLGIDNDGSDEIWYNDEQLKITPQTSLEQFIQMYAKAYNKHQAREAKEELEKSLKNVQSVFENHFKLHTHKVFA